MSKHLVPPVTIKTSAEIFNNEDGLALQRYSTFSGFKVNNISIPKLFPEFTDNDDHGTFVIPEKVGDDNFWPESETGHLNYQSLHQRKILVKCINLFRRDFKSSLIDSFSFSRSIK